MRFFFPLSLFRLVLVWYWHWWHGLWKFYDIKYFNIIKTHIKFVILWYKILVISPTPTSDDASYIRFGETKDKYFKQSLRHGTEMRHRNLRSDSVLVHTSYIGTGALLVPGFSTQSYRRLAHFGPVGRWASISQICAPQPLREPRTQGKFCQERAVPQPTNFVPGNSYRLSPHECGSHARTCTGHSAAHGFIRTRSPSPSQSVSKDAVPHGLTVFGTQVGPASHAAPSVLAETSSSSTYLASRTPPLSRWTRPALQLWSLGKTISGWNRVCPWANWTWEKMKCSIDRECTRLLTSPRFPEIRSEYCVLCRAMWLHDSVVASVEVTWGALANTRII